LTDACRAARMQAPKAGIFMSFRLNHLVVPTTLPCHCHHAPLSFRPRSLATPTILPCHFDQASLSFRPKGEILYHRLRIPRCARNDKGDSANSPLSFSHCTRNDRDNVFPPRLLVLPTVLPCHSDHIPLSFRPRSLATPTTLPCHFDQASLSFRPKGEILYHRLRIPRCARNDKGDSANSPLSFSHCTRNDRDNVFPPRLLVLPTVLPCHSDPGPRHLTSQPSERLRF